jgi:hypothetical protein
LCVRRVGWLAIVGLFSLPLFLGLATGQIGLLAGCCAIAAFELIETRPRVAGALLAALICIKPQVAIAAPIVLLGRWEAIKAGMVCALSILLASLVFGPHLWVEWLHQTGALRAQMPMLPQIKPHVLFGDSIWWRILLVSIGVSFAFWERGLAGFLVGTFLCSPYFWLYDLVGFSFLGLLIVAEWKRFGPLRGLAPSIFGILLVVCPSYPETITIFCLSLIALRVLVGQSSLGRAIEFVPPRMLPTIRLAAEKGANL